MWGHRAFFCATRLRQSVTVNLELQCIIALHDIAIVDTSACWYLTCKFMFCVYTGAACDSNCASGCSVQGAGKCDTTCLANYYLTSSYQCSRELLYITGSPAGLSFVNGVRRNSAET